MATTRPVNGGEGDETGSVRSLPLRASSPSLFNRILSFTPYGQRPNAQDAPSVDSKILNGPNSVDSRVNQQENEATMGTPLRINNATTTNVGANVGGENRSTTSSLPEESFVPTMEKMNKLSFDEIAEAMKMYEECKSKQKIPNEIVAQKKEQPNREASKVPIPSSVPNQEPVQREMNHTILAVRTQVIYRTNDKKIHSGIVVNVPTEDRPLYTVMDKKTQDYVEVIPDNYNIYVNNVPDIAKVTMQKESQVVSQPTTSSLSSAYSIAKEKRSKREKLQFENLPVNRSTCMDFFNHAWIRFGAFEWETPTTEHLLQHRVTTPALAELSRDVYHGISNGKTTTGKLATTEFPILQDITYANKGIEVFWAIFETFCPLRESEVSTMLAEFNCMVELPKESPPRLLSRLKIKSSWLAKSNYVISDEQLKMQFIIGLERGAYKEAYVDMMKENKQGKLVYSDHSLEELVRIATVHLNASKFCVEEGVYSNVPFPPPLGITGAPASSGSKARKMGDKPGETLGPDSSSQEVVAYLLKHFSNAQDDLAKRMFSAFRCPFHLIPRDKRLQKEDKHFINDCPSMSKWCECKYIGGRKPPDSNNNDNTSSDRGRRVDASSPPPEETSSGTTGAAPPESEVPGKPVLAADAPTFTSVAHLRPAATSFVSIVERG